MIFQLSSATDLNVSYLYPKSLRALNKAIIKPIINLIDIFRGSSIKRHTMLSNARHPEVHTLKFKKN